jgi:hypothetical protein
MNKPQRVIRTERVTLEVAALLNEVCHQAQADFPPNPDQSVPAASGIGAQIRAAREARQLTWYSLAELAKIPQPETIRDIEYGRNAQLADVEAVAAALGFDVGASREPG